MSVGDPKVPEGGKTRRHHNNKGYRQIKLGKTTDQVLAMARRLGIPYVTKWAAERKRKDPP